jgi:hypothetical protein
MTSSQPAALIIARHGEAHCNRDQTIGGSRGCHGLTDRGRVQVRRLATRLCDQYPGLHAIYASPLPRAAESAAIVGSMLGMPVTTDEDLLCTAPPRATSSAAGRHGRHRDRAPAPRTPRSPRPSAPVHTGGGQDDAPPGTPGKRCSQPACTTPEGAPK